MFTRILFAVLLTLGSHTLFAGFSINNPVQIQQVSPNATIFAYRVDNTGTLPITLTTSIESEHIEEITNSLSLSAKDKSHLITDMKISPRRVIIPVGESRTFRISIKSDLIQNRGTYYGFVKVALLPPKDNPFSTSLKTTDLPPVSEDNGQYLQWYINKGQPAPREQPLTILNCHYNTQAHTVSLTLNNKSPFLVETATVSVIQQGTNKLTETTIASPLLPFSSGIRTLSAQPIKSNTPLQVRISNVDANIDSTTCYDDPA